MDTLELDAEETIKKLRLQLKEKNTKINHLKGQLKLGTEETIKNLKLQLKERNAKINHLKEQIDFYQGVRRKDYIRFAHLYDAHERLKRKFEANFKFHEYIKDVLDETADLMESVDADNRQ